MKFLFVLVLVALAASEGAILKAPFARSNLYAGYISSGDRLLFRTYIYKQGIPNAIQYQDVIFQGNQTTVISAVTATEVGGSQYASAWILAGGVGSRNVTVRVQSARGWGYYYLMDVWGR